MTPQQTAEQIIALIEGRDDIFVATHGCSGDTWITVEKDEAIVAITDLLYQLDWMHITPTVELTIGRGACPTDHPGEWVQAKLPSTAPGYGEVWLRWIGPVDGIFVVHAELLAVDPDWVKRLPWKIKEVRYDEKLNAHFYRRLV